MIEKITLVNNLAKSMYQKCQQLYKSKSTALFRNMHLTEDVVQLSDKSQVSVLTDISTIIKRKYNSKINDIRLSSFDIEYRANSFEGPNSKFPAGYINVDSAGKRRLKPHLYINMVEVRPEFARQGVYANAIRELKQESLLEKGCEGRIILDARKMNDYTDTQISSSSIAHWKCGFRFANEENNKIMQKVLLGKLPPEAAPEGLMYLAI